MIRTQEYLIMIESILSFIFFKQWMLKEKKRSKEEVKRKEVKHKAQLQLIFCESIESAHKGKIYEVHFPLRIHCSKHRATNNTIRHILWPARHQFTRWKWPKARNCPAEEGVKRKSLKKSSSMFPFCNGDF